MQFLVLGFRILVFEFRIQDLGSSFFGFWIQDSGFWVRFQVFGARIQVFGAGFGFLDSGFKFLGPVFGLWAQFGPRPKS